MSTSEQVFRAAAVQSEIFQCIDQQWRIVETFRANEGHAQAMGPLLKRNIDVVQDLNMIAKKTVWLESQPCHSCHPLEPPACIRPNPGQARDRRSCPGSEKLEVTVSLTYHILQFG